MRKKIIKILGVIFLICVVFILVCNVYNRCPGGSIYKQYFKKAGINKPEIKKYNEKDESFEYKGYTIKLKESLYDEGVHIAYMLFEISKDNGIIKLPVDIFGGVKNPIYKIDDRFVFETPLKYEKMTAKYSGNKVLLYISYYYLESDNVDDLIINLEDLKSESDDYIHSFKIESQNYTKKYSSDGIEVFVSPLGVGIYSHKDVGDENILNYIDKDGKKKNILKLNNLNHPGGGGDSFKDGKEFFNQSIYFAEDEFVDVEKYDNLELNGIKLNLEKNN